MTLGEHFKCARTLADLTQREVERRTGINYKTLSNWENNVSSPSPNDLIALADTYGITIDRLVGHEPRLLGDPRLLGHHGDPEYELGVKIFRAAMESPEIRAIFANILDLNQKTAANGEKGETL